ncbi:hypothetical protein HN51_043205 [Arachis hypogaea]|uniref:Uncharacterized protein n=1 Tax=Arachis hypogaea TaxID=3818 RepID=A0A444Y6S0_ARAHY|nr:uncharacterized protein LOC107611947 isoform X1 [Arachis ipaensis]XP_025671907.1 vascular-related unknown protein 1 [Arachis hypogaea]QHN95346.1 uncharacterized protein DS421_18g608770 [Arachis hypogaea]RYQ97661.1 hypothetical protein Ahy_B08g093739 [Arachis hypogaea]
MMEHSLNPSMGKEAVSDEESGWTSYFQDLSQGMVIKEQSYCLSFGGGSSLVSDASSSSAAAWKKFSSIQQDNNHNHNHHLPSCSSVIRKPLSLPKKLCFKKTRAKQISQEDDDPLEDTASSPLNSPKVGDLNSTETISRKIDDYQLGSVGNKGLESELQTNEGGEVNFHGKKNIDECNDLKKRGLCLVPFSMLVNYYG